MRRWCWLVMVFAGVALYDNHPLGSERPEAAKQLEAAARFAGGEAEAILNRLQRNGGALSSCECGSRNWLPPDGIYQLVAVAGRHPHQIPAKAVVPLTCAACGFTKLYDPAVVASLAESTGRW